MTNKKEQLIEASIDLFSKEGFWNTSTAKIAKHAQVGTGTLFVYFPCKDALIDGVYVQLKHEMAAYVAEGYPETGTVKAQFVHIYTHYVRWAVANPVRFTLLEQLRLSDLVSHNAQEQLTEELAFMKQAMVAHAEYGQFPDIPKDYVRLIVITLMNAAAKYAIAHELRGESLTHHIEQSFAICWNGLSKRSQQS